MPPGEFVFVINEDGACDPVEFKVSNQSPSGKNITFKIRTTEPKYYLVKPNSGVVPPNESKTVTITLNPIPNSTTNHKF